MSASSRSLALNRVPTHRGRMPTKKACCISSTRTICTRWRVDLALSRGQWILGPVLFCLGLLFCGSLRAEAREQNAYPLSGLHWRSIGPAVAGGRVAAVAGTDADDLLYLVGTAGGGVYRTRNGGATWDDVFARQPVAAIGAVAIAPSNSNVVWVGTGESKPRNDISLC